MASSQFGIVWLASYPRSGNTWTRNFLNNLLRIVSGRIDNINDINAVGEFTLWDISAARFEKQLRKKLTNATRDEIASVRCDVHRQIAQEANGIALVKTHNALVMDRGSPTINFSVTAGAIYIVRNPLDVAISFAHHFDLEIDVAIQRLGRGGIETEVNNRVVYEVYGSWSENVMSWTQKPHPTIYVMRYEDILTAPKETFGGLAQHLLIEASNDQINRAIDLSSFEKAKTQELQHGYIERPSQSSAFFRVGRAGQWRDLLSEQQVKRIIADHGEQMARFGYLPEDL